jgi:hypothetical protein
MFSPCPDGGLRCSRWPCRPRTTFMLALPERVPPGGVIQTDRREFMHYPEAGGQTAIHCSQAGSPYLLMLRLPTRLVQPPTPGTEALGAVSGAREHVHVTVAKLSMSAHFLTTLLGRISG